jgi:hypothetical protein
MSENVGFRTQKIDLIDIRNSFIFDLLNRVFLVANFCSELLLCVSSVLTLSKKEMYCEVKFRCFPVTIVAVGRQQCVFCTLLGYVSL